MPAPREVDAPETSQMPRDVRWVGRVTRLPTALLLLGLVVGLAVLVLSLAATDGILDALCDRDGCGVLVAGLAVFVAGFAVLAACGVAAALAAVMARVRRRRRILSYRRDAATLAGRHPPEAQRRIDAWREGRFWGETLAATATFLTGLSALSVGFASLAALPVIVMMAEREVIPAVSWLGALVVLGCVAAVASVRSRILRRAAKERTERMRSEVLETTSRSVGRPTMEPVV